jgi:hypothetical protein
MTPFKYQLPNGIALTSLVMNEHEFDVLCDDLEASKLVVDKGLFKKQIDTIRKVKHLPMVSLGIKTSSLFTKYKVDTPVFCACVRGFADRVLGEDQTAQIDPTSEIGKEYLGLMNKAYDELGQEDKQDLDKQVVLVLEVLNVGKSPEKVIVAYIQRKLVSASRGFRLEFIEQMLRSISETLAVRIQALNDPLKEFEPYVRRLLVNVLVMEKTMRKEKK